ncbi:hypothetical protein KIPB_000811 [Kipferlia bialata]|uniref:DOMON domain-containing protein n=1 Tax=Kipferlia bialata TaxID=797122 RepID=A0A9K3CR47_9EUKA|nr:hypothetical protein KIPB_000811 [Kipferlia bialata]|eukprot:g811.t1
MGVSHSSALVVLTLIKLCLCMCNKMDYFVSGSSGTFGLEAQDYDYGLDTSWALCGKGALTRLHLSGVMVQTDHVNIYTGYNHGDGEVCLDSFPQEIDGDFGHDKVVNKAASCVVVWLHTNHHPSEDAPDYTGFQCSFFGCSDADSCADIPDGTHTSSEATGSFSLSADEYKAGSDIRWVVSVPDGLSYAGVTMSGSIGDDDTLTVYQAYCTEDYFVSYQESEGERMSGTVSSSRRFHITNDHNCFYVKLETAASVGDDAPSLSVQYCTGWHCISRWLFWMYIAAVLGMLFLGGLMLWERHTRRQAFYARLEEEREEERRKRERQRQREAQENQRRIEAMREEERAASSRYHMSWQQERERESARMRQREMDRECMDTFGTVLQMTTQAVQGTSRQTYPTASTYRPSSQSDGQGSAPDVPVQDVEIRDIDVEMPQQGGNGGYQNAPYVPQAFFRSEEL